MGSVLSQVWTSTKLHGVSDAAVLREAAAVRIPSAPPVPAEAALAVDTVHIAATTANAAIANRPPDLPKRLFIDSPTVSLQRQASNDVTRPLNYRFWLDHWAKGDGLVIASSSMEGK